MRTWLANKIWNGQHYGEEVWERFENKLARIEYKVPPFVATLHNNFFFKNLHKRLYLNDNDYDHNEDVWG